MVEASAAVIFWIEAEAEAETGARTMVGVAPCCGGSVGGTTGSLPLRLSPPLELLLLVLEVVLGRPLLVGWFKLSRPWKPDARCCVRASPVLKTFPPGGHCGHFRS